MLDTLDAKDWIATFSPERQAKIEARSEQLLAEELTRQELRRGFRRTRARLARKLDLSPEGIYELEQRADLLLAALRKAAEVMNGKITITAHFPDRAPLEIGEFSEISDAPAPVKDKKKRRAA